MTPPQPHKDEFIIASTTDGILLCYNEEEFLLDYDMKKQLLKELCPHSSAGSKAENVLDKIIKHIIFDIDVAKSAINEKDAVLYQSRIKTLEHILGEITKLQQQEERQYD